MEAINPPSPGRHVERQQQARAEKARRMGLSLTSHVARRESDQILFDALSDLSINNHLGFECLAARHAVCEPFLRGLCPGETGRVTGTFRLETDPERLRFRARIRPFGPFFPGFLRGMIVEWWFAMHF